MSGHGNESPEGRPAPHLPQGGQDLPTQPKRDWAPLSPRQPSAHETPGHDYGYGPPGVPRVPVDHSLPLTALVCNGIATLICCNVLCIGGIVTAALALGSAHTDPEESQNLAKWSWAILIASVALQVIALIFLVEQGFFENDDAPSGSV